MVQNHGKSDIIVNYISWMMT